MQRAESRQSAREFSNHQGCRQAPQERQTQQHEGLLVPRASDDVLYAVRTTGNHEKGSRHQWQKRNLRERFVVLSACLADLWGMRSTAFAIATQNRFSG